MPVTVDEEIVIGVLVGVACPEAILDPDGIITTTQSAATIRTGTIFLTRIPFAPKQ